MAHSDAFVNVLIIALDDVRFRRALAADVSNALKGKKLLKKISKKEIKELEKIFREPEVKGQEASSIACGYRGFSTPNY